MKHLPAWDSDMCEEGLWSLTTGMQIPGETLQNKYPGLIIFPLSYLLFSPLATG